jgi:hypothetical protein
MAQQINRVIADGNPRPFDARALLRLAIWGVAAATALSIAVLAGYSNPAAQRVMGTMAAAIGQTQKRAETSPAQTPTRSAEADSETRRLAEAVRALAGDRNELLTRLSAIEQSLEDITGSINRQTLTSPPPPLPASTATDASVLFSDPMTPPVAFETASPLPALASVAPGEFPRTPSRDVDVSPLGGSAEADLLNPKIEPKSDSKSASVPELGVDIGGAANFDALRLLWNSTKANSGALLGGLSPRVGVRENSKSRAAELRLIVGPLADAEAATRLCATFSAARRACQPTPFVGQPFAQSVPEPERKPAPVVERKPAPPAAPAPARPQARPNP